MRPIKFRAWDEDNKEMVEADLDYFTDASRHCPFRSYVQRMLINGRQPNVMEFTGLLDKSGKEIWEGDVVGCVYGYADRLFEVYFEDGLFSMKTKDGLSQPVYLLGKVSEVLGTIYENPELIS